MIRKYLPPVVGALVLFSVSVIAIGAEKSATPSPTSIVVLGRNVTLQHVTGCPKHTATPKELSKYLNQYDVQTERDFYSTAYKYSKIDPGDGYPGGDLEKNWQDRAQKEVVESGFGGAYKSGVEIDPISWVSFTGDGICGFSSFQSLVGMKASVGRWFLFRGLKKKGYQLVMSDAGDQGGAYGQGFISLTVSSESFPIIVYLGGGSGGVFQWNKSIKGFNVCPKTSDVDEMPAFKIYTKTAIAPKDSFLGKLCSSPEARAKLVQFLGGAN